MSSPTPLAYIPPPPSNGFHVGPLFFHFYGLLIAIGVLLAFWLARRRWQQAGHDPAEIEVPGIWAVVAGFVGGRLAYVSTHSGEFSGRWLHVFAIWEGGLALYGGLTLGILTGIFVAWRRGMSLPLVLDAAIPAIPLAQAFGRWGNYFNQELFGTPTRLPWALEVEPSFRPAKYREFATFHPTFLYESIWNLLIVAALLYLSAKRTLRAGSIVLCYLVLYAFGRFLLELIRTDTTFRLFGLSRNAYVSLAVMIGAGVWLYLRERARPAEEEPRERVTVGAPAAGAGAAAGGVAEGGAAPAPPTDAAVPSAGAATGGRAEQPGEGAAAAEPKPGVGPADAAAADDTSGRAEPPGEEPPGEEPPGEEPAADEAATERGRD
jgi:prolipoprotein diacylglyceryl transferase